MYGGSLSGGIGDVRRRLICRAGCAGGEGGANVGGSGGEGRDNGDGRVGKGCGAAAAAAETLRMDRNRILI